MQVDKSSLKRLIEQSKLQETLVLQVNSIEKDSLKFCQREIDKFIKKTIDYVVIVIRK